MGYVLVDDIFDEMSQNIKKKEEHGYKILQMLEELNKETSYMYTDIKTIIKKIDKRKSNL